MGIKTSIFKVDPSADLEAIWQWLEEEGCHLLYSDADENAQQIFGHLPNHRDKQLLLETYPEILTIEEVELPEIDWEAQWAVQENYQNGFLHVDLKDYAPQIHFNKWPNLLKLIPGSGFGDLSHPTTRLVLKLMPAFIQNQPVVDVGCGSGVLSLAAVTMGASFVRGIDIDPDALVHSEANRECNGMEKNVQFFLPEQVKSFSNDSVVLMNMIQSEQVVAWGSLAHFTSNVSFAITSGILAEGRKEYLQLSEKWGWQLIQELEEEGWLGFVFKTK